MSSHWKMAASVQASVVGSKMRRRSAFGARVALGLRIEGLRVRPTATTRNVVSSMPAKRKPAPLP